MRSEKVERAVGDRSFREIRGEHMNRASRGEVEVFDGAGTAESGARVPARLNDLSHEVIGCAMRVHSALGPGLPERIYAAALTHELQRREIDVSLEVPVTVVYEGRDVGLLRLDLVVDGSIVVELKVVEQVLDLHLAQLVSYLRAGCYPLGLLINFNVAHQRDGIYRRLNAAAIKRESPP